MKIGKGYFHVLVALISVAYLSGLGFGQQRKITSQTIMNRMAQRYANCSSYQDVGVVETTHNEANSARIERMPFKTYFVRPQFFRFEWIDYFPWKDGLTNIVWCNGKDSFTYLEPDTYEKEEYLGRGIAGATGISRGSAHTISRLLMAEEMSGFALTELTSLALVGEDQVEGELCYRVNGIHPFGDIYELWISKKDYLLRKLREKTTDKDYTTTKEVTYRNIKLNEIIAKDVFNFKPPIALTEKSKESPESLPLFDEKPTWAEFNSPEGGFKLLMPGDPVKQTLTLEAPTGKIVHNIFTAAKGGIICIVDYADLPRKATDVADANGFFDVVRDEILKITQGKLGSETAISLDGHPGREVKIIVSGQEAKARFYLVNQRFYQMLIMKMVRADKSSKDIDNFFDSFKLVGNTKPIAIYMIEQHGERKE
ncbi:MAG TPA: DUF2092 domain-containing protein [Blastocatellia bacterium]|nr:DUF2092 domain-containing protein [Blastocatellia bacterium]